MTLVRARLVPELLCSDIGASLAFYTGPCGFEVLYDRPEDGFAYLDLEGNQIMLDEADAGDDGAWWTARPQRPYGRGINLQMQVGDVDAIHRRIVDDGRALYRPLGVSWYRVGERETGNRQFLVQDPDGYLLRFYTDLGERPVGLP